MRWIVTRPLELIGSACINAVALKTKKKKARGARMSVFANGPIGEAMKSLRPNQCRYLVVEGNKSAFCCEDRMEGSAFCPKHRKLAHYAAAKMAVLREATERLRSQQTGT